MPTTGQRRRTSKLLKFILAAVIVTLAAIIAMLAMIYVSRAHHLKAGSCPNATAEWKRAIIVKHVEQSNLPDFNDGKDVELLGGDSWQESDGTWGVPFTTGHGQHHFTAIITCDGVSELSTR